MTSTLEMPVRQAGLQRIYPTNAFVEFPRSAIDHSIVDRFEEQVKKHSKRLAIKDGSREWTYDALNQKANQIARAILEKVGESQGPAAFLLQRGAVEVAAIFGILKAGKFYVPLDASYPPARLTEILEDIRPQILLTDNQQIGLARELTQSQIPLLNLDELDQSGDNLGLSITPDRYAYVLYTSSSTGRAKGVLHNHRNVLHLTRNYANGSHICAADRLTLLPSTSFAASVVVIFGGLLNGAALFPYNVREAGLVGLSEWLNREKITIYQSVPTLFRRWMEVLNQETFPHVRLVVLGGESVLRADVEKFRAHFGPDCLLKNGLGTTELSFIREFYVDHHTPLPDPRVPVGWAVADNDVFILDEQGNPVGPNTLGEITVRSRYLALGYWGDAELTNQVFRTDRAGSDQRLYRTGDLGKLRPDGCLEHHGRKDLQVKVRGHRIEITEIEQALLTLEGVKEAVVMARADRSGDARLVAYVVPRGPAVPTASTLRRGLHKVLPNYMMPAAFVLLDSLPLTLTAKVDRLALPAPSGTRPVLDCAFRRLEDPSQLLLAGIWEDLLDVRPVGADDSFFDLGGDSLLAVSLLNRIEETCGRVVPQSDFMAQPTIAALGRILIDQDRAHVQPAIVKVRDSGRKSPFFFFHGDFNGGGYFSYTLAGKLDPDCPLYFVHPHGLFTPHVPLTFEAMAAELLDAVRAIQPKGPYLLGGHCNGGLVALELARLLRRRGERVALLAVIAPPRLRPRDSFDVGLLPPTNLLGHTKPIQLSRFDPKDRRQAVSEIYRAIIAQYQPRPYSGKLTLLHPKHDSAPTGIWRDLVRDVEFRQIPGNHLTSITQHAVELAEQLNQCFAALGAPRN